MESCRALALLASAMTVVAMVVYVDVAVEHWNRTNYQTHRTHAAYNTPERRARPPDCAADPACVKRHRFNPTDPACRRPRPPLGLFPRPRRPSAGGVNLSQVECARDVRWLSGAGGWDPTPPAGNRNEIALGQNLEDAVVMERFFRRGPLAFLTAETGIGLSGMSRGVFVEMGALDGVTFSNTLALEHCLGWTGLLIEAQPENARRCKTNRPCTPVVAGGACADNPGTLLISETANGVAFVPRGVEAVNSAGFVRVGCRPLSVVFGDHNLTRIHFFSLDVEGAELDVLRTVDWRRVRIDVLMVETTAVLAAAGTQNSQNSADFEHRIDQKTAAVREYLASVGMRRVPSRATLPDRLASGLSVHPRALSVSGSDIFVGNGELFDFDRRLHALP